jgi:hypothetical protein
VAFHEGGLNYGSEEETKDRIVKKYIRTALSIYKYFGVKTADIYFVTPNTRDRYINTYIEAKSAVQDFFSNEGFDFTFHFYSNEDFYSFIFIPVERVSQIMTDTSELFARSLKLTRLMREEHDKKVSVIQSETTIPPNLEEKKIGLYVREVFDDLSKNNRLDDEMIKKLQSSEYSKDTFNSSFPVLIEDEKQIFDKDGRRRYYSTPYLFNEKKYFLCNHWFDSQKDNLIKWYDSIRK